MPTEISHLIPLARERTSDAIFQILLDCITTRVFQPGERLDVKELARKLDVSATPIKDALNRLAAQGLIEIRPRKGTYVTDLTAEELAETFEIRMALECLAVEKAVERISPEVIERYRQLIADLEKPVDSENDLLFHEQKNEEFHNTLIELSGNQKLKEMYRGLKAHIKIVRIHCLTLDSSVKRRIEGEEKAEHREILAAIEARDRGQMVRALRKHIQRGSECLLQDFTKLEKAGAQVANPLPLSL